MALNNEMPPFVSQLDGTSATYLRFVYLKYYYVLISMSCILQKNIFWECVWYNDSMIDVKDNIKDNANARNMQKHVASVKNWREMKQLRNVLKFIIA